MPDLPHTRAALLEAGVSVEKTEAAIRELLEHHPWLKAAVEEPPDPLF